MTTATKARQTAGNNATLARIKEFFNHKVYALALRTMNEQGPEAVRALIREFFNEQSRHRADEIIDGTGTGV